MTESELRTLIMGFQPSRVVLTAFELGVFSAIAAGHTDAASVARVVGAEARATDRLLDALVAVGLLTKAGGRFANEPIAERYLVRGGPDYMAGMQHTVNMWDSWSGLTGAVRSGQPAMGREVNDRGAAWLEAFIEAMHWRARTQAGVVAGLLPVPQGARVLDVGGGSGAFSMALARRDEQLTAVVFDLPNVVPLTARFVAGEGLSDRITTVAGNYMRDPLPAGFDLVLLSAIVHSNTPQVNATLIRACAAALRAGGRVVVSDWVMSADRTSPAGGTLFALNMLVASGGGDTFTEAEMRAWFEAAGLPHVERIETPFGTSLLIAGAR